ncbi:prepilin-type N-terminal cleavage/methylation domain-containing protein [Bacillus sp. DNRA2]|uniref:prepilin-type N-terminal cleavage/methylation domain-containing protein n=1 Tax=Bacillus sp. DNRA2 TaxID=2723053 RepID=UPI00145DE7D9|nr:prepilin-type N-terminal cleavage/methylation domain-containing protein [Bacillus sp. DNRA2]NMD70523.1 prepilin-type N-terminal cleavage/methylation domain-containing protein [Bacillus sp. DNRA2]
MNIFNKKIVSDKGMTLVEILAALVIISIVIVSLLSMFVQSARSTETAKNRVDSTYISETEMEAVYNISTTTTLANSSTKITTNLGYSKITTGCPSGACYAKKSNNRYVFLNIKASGAAVIKIYRDETKQKQEAQMEMLITWKQT